jgi:hypothetical protein
MQDSAIQFGTGYVLPSSLFFPEKRNKPVAGSGLFYSAVIPLEPRQQNYNTRSERTGAPAAPAWQCNFWRKRKRDF